MAKPKILLQLDPDAHASSFDAVVAVDAGVDHLLQYRGVEPTLVQSLVHGAIFTRGPADLHSTAIFIGGTNVTVGEELLKRVVECFFGPMRVSVLMDANGANTTAAAAVLACAKHVNLKGATATVLAGTGPVGQRATLLMAREGATVHVASRSRQKAESVCEVIRKRVPGANLKSFATGNDAETIAALCDSQVVISAGAAKVTLLSAEARKKCASLKVAVDLNAVPPLGIEGIGALDKAKEVDSIVGYGALGVGGMKMKIHKAALAKLFEVNDAVLDAAEVFELAKGLGL